MDILLRYQPIPVYYVSDEAYAAMFGDEDDDSEDSPTPAAALPQPSANTADPNSVTLAGMPDLMLAAEVMRVLRVSKRTLDRLVATGRLVAQRAHHAGSSRRFFPKWSVEKYLREIAES